ncbi:MAG: CRISPR-associated helicase Cas3' [Gemmatimonadota bacterium]|nr:CRISPR-associated helicase Cas3' [Gemmatimonadota bacterium]
MAGYSTFFRDVTGNEPFPHQARMGQEAWPDVVDVPTGLGKTAGVAVAWLWKRLNADEATPTRLVYCLPMRVLVDQTSTVVGEWIERAEPYFTARSLEPPLVRTLMGGRVEDDWRDQPDRAAFLVGTQDMLLSRALMRGYGMSRYLWPLDYALLHNDAMWVYDEVQLMGPALETSAQLDAFRRVWPQARTSRSLWLSATLREDWLETVDFAPHTRDLAVLRISAEDRQRVSGRLSAKKVLSRSEVTLEGTAKNAVAEYTESLAAEVAEYHQPGSQTLIVVNRVDRAQALYAAIREVVPDVEALLLHARFRSAERAVIEDQLQQGVSSGEGRIVVATQAIEAGVDITSSCLFTELAPWSSMVQRFGRCNRYGEVEEGAEVVWIDMQLEGKDAAPYDAADLATSRAILEAAGDDVSPASLNPVSGERPVHQVVRRKDFLELFNTDPDLQGFDVDIAPYIRDEGPPQVQVYWRVFEDGPANEIPSPQREELCNVSMGQFDEYLKKSVRKRARAAWQWDPLLERWQRKTKNDSIVPGAVLLLRSTDGGYDVELGFEPSSKADVLDLLTLAEGGLHEVYGGDPRSHARTWVELSAHLEDAKQEAERITESVALPISEAKAVSTAALWHDIGKAHPAFRTALLDAAEPGEGREERLWAKSPGRGRPRYRVVDGETTQRRPFFRHELASMLAWLAHNPDHADRDLIAFLIAAHHGKVRMGLRAMPTEPMPDDGRLVARGIWDGDILPALGMNGVRVPQTELRLDLMRLGRGPSGPSWTERTQALLEAHGPFQLSWLEALVRLADWSASGVEEGAADV